MKEVRDVYIPNNSLIVLTTFYVHAMSIILSSYKFVFVFHSVYIFINTVINQINYAVDTHFLQAYNEHRSLKPSTLDSL